MEKLVTKKRDIHIEEKDFKTLVSVLRRASMRWYGRAEAIRKARVELPPVLKKDGSPSKNPQIKYRCVECKSLVKSTEYSVDHNPPVVDLEGFDSMGATFPERVGTFVLNLFCLPIGWRVICNNCHDEKTKAENKIRRGEDVSKVNFKKSRRKSGFKKTNS